MILPLLYAGMGATAYVTSGKLQEGAAENGMKFQEYAGVETPKLLGGLGLAGLIFGGPVVAAIGAGLALGSLEAHRNVTVVREGIATYIKQQMGPTLPGPTAPQIPPTLPVEPTIWNLPGRMLDALLPSQHAPVPT